MPGHKRQKAGRYGALLAVFAVLFILLGLSIALRGVVLRISDWKTGEVYVEHPVSPGDELYFGWIHSLEKIPWDEYYHIDENLNLILDTISFTAFGAGIPQDKGSVCYIKDGVIYMSGINQKFTEFVWMNSPTATQEIRVGGGFVTRGSELPHNRRLVLTVKRRNPFGK
jgi:hypothetical protein